MSKMTIHYQEQPDLSIPRPHHVEVDATKSPTSPAETHGGQVGDVQLLGVSPTVTPDVDNWVMFGPGEMVEQLAVDPHSFDGWFAQLYGPTFYGPTLWGYPIAIDRIEVA